MLRDGKKKDCEEAGEEFPMLKIIVEDDSQRIVSLSTRMPIAPYVHALRINFVTRHYDDLAMFFLGSSFIKRARQLRP